MNESSILNSLNDEERSFLEKYHFDREAFESLRTSYLLGELNEESNRIVGDVQPPSPDDVVNFPPEGSRERAELEELGRQTIADGEVGHVVLNGGMATRFGGVVKGAVDVADGISFLGLKILDARRWDDEVPLILMNSFATNEKTVHHLNEHRYFGIDPNRVWSFDQNISVRLSPDGSLFREDDGGPSFYGPGHGDLPSAINRGTLRRFRERGGRYVLMSNVDNVLATVDPLVVGMHVAASRRGVQMTIESAPRYQGDKGGMPARVDGRLQVVEAFRFPRGFDDSSIPVFNTNTFLFDADALARPFDLTWFVVQKQVEGRPAVQFERLAGELSAFLNCQFLAVPREGAESRFLPIKTPDDLDDARGYLRQTMKARSVL